MTTPVTSVEDLLGPAASGGAPTSPSPAPAVPAPGGGRSTTTAEDLADAAARGAGGGEAEPPGPGVGRSSARAAAGFNRKKSKPELIQLGRDVATENERLRGELAALRGGKVETPTPAVPIDPSALIAPLGVLTKILEGFLVAWRGDHWQFSEEERTNVPVAAAPVVAKHAGALGEHLDVFVLAVTLAGIAIPRLKQDRELREKREATTAQQRKEG
jgi:hypothetical protein